MKASEAKASRFLINNLPVYIIGNALFTIMHRDLIALLDQHAADQREIDIKALRNVCQHFMGHSFNTGSLALLEDAILNATGERI